MIRFSVSGCAIIELDQWTGLEEMFKYIDMFKDERDMDKNVEFVIRTPDRILDVNDEPFYYNGGKARTFTITDVRWKHLKRVAKMAFVTVQQGSWYFTFAKEEGIGYWYSGDMLSVGWWHGEQVQPMDHQEFMYKRRDYARS